VALGELAEDEQHGDPDDDEEEDDEQRDLPDLRVRTAPQVLPVAAGAAGQEVVLDDDDDKEPEHDLAAQHGLVEGRHVAWRLAIVGWQAEEADGADAPDQACDGHHDGGEGQRVRGDHAVGEDGAAVDHVLLVVTPGPEADDVDLLRALDDTGTEDPGFNRGAWETSVRGLVGE